jgi:hypothetical protein
MFYLVNWLFILTNVIMFYRIRFIRDRLSVRTEMGWLVGVYTFFCYIQYFIYILSNVSSCDNFKLKELFYNYSHFMTYFTILFRDMFLLAITTYYLKRASIAISETRLAEGTANETHV